MSRIQTILDKAEREGTAKRFRTDAALPVAAEAPSSWPGGEAATPPRPDWPGVRAHQVTPEPRNVPVPRRITAPPLHTNEGVTDDPVGRVRVGDSHDRLADDETAWQEAADPVVENQAGVETEPATETQPTINPRRSLSPSLVAALHPNALAAEQFRTLRTRIANSTNGRGARTLLLTSPGHREGKSVMAANLALTMGQEIQQRVCLVDASLRDASIHALFGLPEGPGLVDVLVGDATLDEALVYLEEHALTVLPAGRLPRHPAELLASREMRKTLETLRSRFDRVIIDAPPAMPMADVSILTPQVDGVLVICRAGVTTTPALQQAVGSLDPSRVLGVVLNDIHP